MNWKNLLGSRKNSVLCNLALVDRTKLVYSVSEINEEEVNVVTLGSNIDLSSYDYELNNYAEVVGRV